MDIKEIIIKNRNFMKSDEAGSEEIVSDQMLKLPQPPLYKSAVSDTVIDLPDNFRDLKLKNDLLDLFYKRHSARIFTEESLSLLELSYLLWAAQGVKEVRGRNFATMRTVPSGGARHPFEIYMIVNNVDTLVKGLYHYLPENHQLELLETVDEVNEMMDVSVAGQSWAKKANLIMYFSFVAYRAEWRYSIYAQRSSLMDIGYVGENLYLASESLSNVGGCALASYNQKYCDNLFNLDGTDEFVIYAHVIGKTKENDEEEKKHFFSIHQI